MTFILNNARISKLVNLKFGDKIEKDKFLEHSKTPSPGLDEEIFWFHSKFNYLYEEQSTSKV